VVAVSRSEFRGLVRELRPAPYERRSMLGRLGVFVWRNLPEIIAAALVWWAWSRTSAVLGALVTLVLAGVLAVAVLSVPWSRRATVATFGLWLTRRRLSAALREVRLATRAGRLPVTLWLAPTPVGERVWLWCRVGISAEDIADEIDRLRAACVARDVRVTRSPRFGALVTVEVIRRDPLTATRVVTSPLADIASRREAVDA
jgi:hypothetical protein